MTTTVSPSPRELVARLSDDEKVALDLILEANDDGVPDGDARFAELVPESGRRGYLITLAGQLRELGLSVRECVGLDQQRATWEQARERYARECAERAASRSHEIAEQQRRDAALPPEARRSVMRRRRRQARRAR